MKKQSANEEQVDTYLWEQMREEAKRIEEASEKSITIVPEGIVKDTYRRIIEEIQQGDKSAFGGKSATQANDPASATKISETEKINKIKRFPTKRISKWVAAVVLICIGVFGISMTSQANRLYMMQQLETILGKDTQVVIDDDENRDDSNTEEREARNEIHDKLDVEVPYFAYKPDGFQLSNYDVLETDGLALVQYVYKEYALTLQISVHESNSTQSIEYNNELMSDVEMDLCQGKAQIYKVVDEEDEYVAQWVYKNNFYNLSGKIGIEELKKILEYISY
ncbi:MAG: DUF4367 domain-containing protein [Lachnospiraceae bacterium]|nr:DUF4367 domain-containing protein [Lachnospiraceae bacterium]MDD3614782.1 DUF4367 domain-containing protein [Lachnospiraceae bacterium]